MSDLISRQAAIDAAIEAINEWGGGWDAEREARDAINALPSAQPELIAQGAYVRGFEQGRTQGMLDAKLQPTCNQLATDTISRQAAIDAICKEGTRLERNGTVAMCEIKQWCIDLLERLPSAQPEIIRCKECKHRPVTNADYDFNEWDCGLNIEFPDYRCPCQCDDAYYNRLPDDDWFCGNAERKTDA